MIITVKNTLPKEYKNDAERRKEIQRVYAEVQNAIHLKQSYSQYKTA